MKWQQCLMVYLNKRESEFEIKQFLFLYLHHISQLILAVCFKARKIIAEKDKGVGTERTE